MGDITILNISIILSFSLGLFLIWFSFYPDNINFLKDKLAKKEIDINKNKEFNDKDFNFFIKFAVLLAKKISALKIFKPNQKEFKQIDSLLIKADYPLNITPQEFYCLKFAFFIIFNVLLIYIVFLMDISFYLLLPFPILLSLFVPKLWIKEVQDKRTLEIDEDITDVLDLIAVCIKHMPLVKTIQTVALSKRCLATDELLKLVNEINNGEHELKAFENLKNRNNSKGFFELYNIVKLYVNYGTSISKTILDLSLSYRDGKSHEIKTKTEAIAIKMLFPIVFFILPATVLILFSPMIYKLMNF